MKSTRTQLEKREKRHKTIFPVLSAEFGCDAVGISITELVSVYEDEYEARKLSM